MIKLYDYFRSTASYRVRIALNYKGLAYECIPVNLIKDGGEQHQAAYTLLNPQELVPTLIDPKLTEPTAQSMAILEYLEEAYPEPPLLPKPLEERLEARRIAHIIACDMHPLNNLRVLQYLVRTLKSSEDEKLAWYHHWLRCGFDAIEALLQHKKASNYCVGNQISLADICLVPQLYNANRFDFDISSYQCINQIADHLSTHEAFEKAVPINPSEA